MKYALYLMAVASTVWILPTTAAAQFVGMPDEVDARGTSYRIFAYPGQRTVTVQFIGDVGGSGIYVVGEDTSLTELLALAGGAPLGEPGTRTRRTVTVRVFRDAGGIREAIYEADMPTLLREPGQYPKLQDGDMVTVDVELRERFDVFRAMQVASTLGTFALLILRVTERL